MQRPALSVIGTGYLGATHAVCMASVGYDVVGVDVDPAKVDRLAAGTVPFYEPGLEPLLRKTLETGRLRFTTRVEDAAAGADVHFLCVGTPQLPGGYGADLSYVEAACAAVLPHLRPGALLVGKSTVPAGTAARMAIGMPAGTELAWNPEFLREGLAVEDTLAPSRLVFGVASERAEQLLRASYQPLIEAGVPVVVTDFATAELVKVAANAFLATKISFINAMAEICETTQADVMELAAALAYDPRIGGQFLHPGLGFGGGCLPKDIRGFMARARELGVADSLAFLAEVDAINARQRVRAVGLARELAGGELAGARVAVLGAAFKPDSDDIRDSPALEVAANLQREGAEVLVHDPAAIPVARVLFPDLSYAASTVEACEGADLVALLTEWEEFRDLEPTSLGRLVRHRRILDARNVLDPQRWAAAGWTYRGLGRPARVGGPGTG